MFRKEFIELARYAHSKSEEKFRENLSIEANPYFLGFGNPNSDILFVGQEMAIDPIKNPVTLEMESYRNPEHWHTLIKENISNLNYSFNSKNGFLNPRKPYNTKTKGTWRSYQQLIEKIKNLEFAEDPDFFNHCFITEMNISTSKKQLGFQDCEVRDLLLQNDFYKTFPITILATGSYIHRNKIERVFRVKHSELKSNSEPNKRLEIYFNEDKSRVLINTRQLSNFRFNGEEKDLYFHNIANNSQVTIANRSTTLEC